MKIRHLDMAPSVHPEAYVAPSAVLSGEVRVGSGSCIMHGAVLAAEGGPVDIGANCVIMENAVLRGTQRHPLIMGDHVLAGPHSHLTGCVIADEVFIATGAMVFNGTLARRWQPRPVPPGSPASRPGNGGRSYRTAVPISPFLDTRDTSALSSMPSAASGRSGSTRYRVSELASHTRISVSCGSSSPNSASTARGSRTTRER